MIFNYLYFNPKGLGKPICVYNNKIHRNLSNFKNDDLFLKIPNEFLKNLGKSPYFYFCGTHNIEHLTKFEESSYFKMLRAFKNVDFYFFEPLTHYLTISHLNYVPHVIKTNNEDYDMGNIRCKELDSISEWAEKHKLKNITVYCTDFTSEKFYKTIYPNLKLKCYDVLTAYSSSNQSKKIQESIENVSASYIEKKFIVPSWRYESPRHFLISYMAYHDLIKDSNVSFYYKITNNKLIAKSWVNWNELSFKLPEFSESILKGNEILHTMLPLSMDAENPIAIDNTDVYPNDNGINNIVLSHKPEDFYRKSFLSIIMESRVTQPWPNISEKTINSIIMLKPFILVGAPGCLDMLKQMGFKTFSNYWPEDYDNIVHTDVRLSRICEIIKNISAMSVEDMQLMYNDMLPTLIHNAKQIEHIRNFFIKYNKR